MEDTDGPPRTGERAFHGRSSGKEGVSLLGNATFIALERLIRLCIDVHADALILAGDIYNAADSSLRARLALREGFLTLEKAGISVFFAHGNHDPVSSGDGTVPWPANVTVFGPDVSCHPLEKNGKCVALVHGISHSTPSEGRNLAQLFLRSDGSVAHDVFQMGVLHCAVSGNCGEHALYAPCTLSDLAAARLDYWALGHVHSCRVMGQPSVADSFSGPLAAYSGSLQGLHVNESGPHGCLVGKVDTRGNLALDFVPLAAVQWESVTVDLDKEEEFADIPSFSSFLLETLAAFALPEGGELQRGGDFGAAGIISPASEERASGHRGWEPELLAVRVLLRGATPLDPELRKPGAAEELRKHINSALSGTRRRVRDIRVKTKPPFDEEGLVSRDDLAGETQRITMRWLEDPEEIQDAAATAFHPLFKSASARSLIPFPDTAELAGMVDEARLLCLSLLEGNE